MRLIDADALSKHVLEWLPSDPCGRSEAEYPFETDICVSMLMEIKEAPTIDAVHVVKCKDCIMTRIYDYDSYSRENWCIIHKNFMQDDYFCADGRRKL